MNIKYPHRSLACRFILSFNGSVPSYRFQETSHRAIGMHTPGTSRISLESLAKAIGNIIKYQTYPALLEPFSKPSINSSSLSANAGLAHTYKFHTRLPGVQHLSICLSNHLGIIRSWYNSRYISHNHLHPVSCKRLYLQSKVLSIWEILLYLSSTLARQPLTMIFVSYQHLLASWRSNTENISS